jgi:hypothetical protein
MDFVEGSQHNHHVTTSLGEVADPPTAARAFRLRRWLTLVFALVLLIPVGIATFVWHANTKQLEVTRTVGPVAPGESVSVAVTSTNGCMTSYDRLYRRIAGRWLQTHWRDTNHDRTWLPAEGYELWTWPKTRQEFSGRGCPIGVGGFAILVVPPDADSTPLLACTFGDDACVLIKVTL